ncbi:MAG: GNAT family N-acetyltransferase [Clostridia bacterium]|nr:GNAT family N-acetyltransferase [Clostridia bacterium]
MAIIYKGRGAPEMYDDLMDFMNYVFGFNGDDRDFKKLLPKLYKPEYDPCHSNYVVTEDGKLKAAVGVYDSTLNVGGTLLKSRGVGNVAVHPYSRSKGYMIDCMNLALRDMIADGIDFSILGGQRQRYGYFGYDHAGQQVEISIGNRNLRHCFRNVPFVEYELRELGEGDGELIGKAYELQRTRPMRTERARAAFLDICRSWRSSLSAVLKDGEFRGYFVGDLKELTLLDPGAFNDVVRNYVKQRGDVNLHIPTWDAAQIAAAAKIGGGLSLGACEMFNILRFRRVTEACLNFKAAREELCGGELSLLVHGYAGDESFRLAVRENEVAVEPCAPEAADLELSHMEAMALLFGLWSDRRRALSPAVRSWFPLPLHVESADHV